MSFKGAQSYIQLARLDRPIGWWLLLVPCLWSSVLASLSLHQFPNVAHLGLLMLGAIVMRGAGSTWNDILDRKLDAQVERTRNRPLASGALTPKQAAVFLIAQCLIGLGVLLCFNAFTIKLGLASLVPVAIYPLMKRVTNHPQIVLGLAFAWGALVGWSAETGNLELAPLLLYCAAIFWTIGYDTIYALQDLEDDLNVGIGSTALAYGQNVARFVALCYMASIWLILASLYVSRLLGWFTMLGVLAFALHCVWQVRRIQLDNPQRALELFKSNRNAGLLLFAGFLIQAVKSFLMF